MLDHAVATLGAVVGGRATYDAVEGWGGENPWGLPFFIVTHRPDEAPGDSAFTFVDALEEALTQARAAAGDKRVGIMGGADVIRQALGSGLIDELTVSVARPSSLAAGSGCSMGSRRPLAWSKSVSYSRRG